MFYFLHVKFSPKFGLHGGHSFVYESAGVDEPESIKVRIDIECQSMHRDISAAFHSKCAYLSFIPASRLKPYAGSACYPLALYAEISYRADYCFLQKIHIIPDP